MTRKWRLSTHRSQRDRQTVTLTLSMHGSAWTWPNSGSKQHCSAGGRSIVRTPPTFLLFCFSSFFSSSLSVAKRLDEEERRLKES